MITNSRVEYTHETVASSDGVVSFNVSARFTPVEGDLPDGVNGVFLMRAVAPLDPKADVFVRVAVLGDLGVAATSREISLDPARYEPAAKNYIASTVPKPTGYYLTPNLTLGFDRLDVAIQSKAVIEQRIDSLILDWKTYRNSLYADIEQVFPLDNAGLVADAKTKYYDSVAAVTAAQDALAAATSAYDDAVAARSSASTELARLEALQPQVCSTKTFLDSFITAYATYFNEVTGGRKTLRDNVTPSTALTAEAELFKNLSEAYVTSFGTAYARATSACTTLTNQQTNAQASVEGAKNDVATYDGQKRAAQKSLDAAQTAKAAALAELLAVCPSFVP